MSWCQSYETFEVYRIAFDASMEIMNLTRDVPTEETSLFSDQIRNSARCVCYHISEAIRTRNQQTIFLYKLAQARDDAEETIAWIRHAVSKEYITIESGARLYSNYSSVIGKLISLLTRPTPQVLKEAA
jgi:four helix bundle protein